MYVPNLIQRNSILSSDNKVQLALDFYDSVLKPLYGLMYESENSHVVRFDDDVGTIIMRNARYIRSRHGIQLYCSLESVGDLCVMSIHKMPTMLFRPNAVLDKKMRGTSVSTLDNPFKRMGTGGLGADSTVSFPDSSVRQVPSVQDIRTRTEELNFELLMDMNESYIVPFIVNALFNQDFDSVDLEVECCEETFHVCELAYKQLLRETS